MTDENGQKEMSEELQFWSFLSVDGDRQHGGNLGCEDAAETNYEYDSLVGNHKQIKIGDIAFVRDREEVSGIAVVKQIEEWDGDKLTLNGHFDQVSLPAHRTQFVFANLSGVPCVSPAKAESEWPPIPGTQVRVQEPCQQSP